jgi:hypothetical protein
MSCGKDGDPSTRGVQRWRPLGRFEELAELMQKQRQDSAIGMGATDLTETQESFVEQYIEAGLPTDKETVSSNIQDNINEFDGCTVDPILAEIERRTIAERFSNETVAFVSQYIESNLPTDEETIESNLEANSSEFENDPNVDQVVQSIQRIKI